MSGGEKTHTDEYWMRRCLSQLSQLSQLSGLSEVDVPTSPAKPAVPAEVPIAACVVIDNTLISMATNAPITLCDPTAHAEILAIRKAAEAVGNYRLSGATLYVTLQPCVMCVGALIQARIGRVVFGAHDEKKDFLALLESHRERFGLNHHVKWVGGVCTEACSELLTRFFSERRG